MPRFVRFFSRGPVSLRIYIARISLRAVLVSCLASLALVCLAFLGVDAILGTTLSGPVPALVGCCAVCALTLVTSMHQIMRLAGRFSRPLELMERQAAQIARGTFDVSVGQECRDLGITELDSLVGSFDKMAHALAGMDYLRRDFTSSVSHELKTPIAAIAGMCELVADPKLPEGERGEYLALIREQAGRLSSLCESMLAMSRLDAQQIVARRERTDVDEQIRRDVIMLQERWLARRLSVELDLDSPPIETDPDLTHQVWINLIDNAFKYTDDGGHIHVRSRATEGGVEVRVADTGQGMSDETASHAFERFYQADGARSAGGAGLGLPIARRICELLGGSVSCRSTLGEGTVMTVRLPRRLA